MSTGQLRGELDGGEFCREALAAALRDWGDSMHAAFLEPQESGRMRDDIDPGELSDIRIESREGRVIRTKIERSLQPLGKRVRRRLHDYFQP